MSISSRIKRLGDVEAELAAACSAITALRPDEAFSGLAREHRETATRLRRGGAPLRELYAAGRALWAMLRGGAVAWLRAREHQLVCAYLSVDTVLGLDDETRAALRREWLPAAFDRYTRVDRMLADGEGG
jgi:hypothetical protein